MLDRSGPLRTALAVAGTVVVALAASAPAMASPFPSPSPIGGAQLAGRGVIVNYAPGPVPELPGIKASAWVIAGTGQAYPISGLFTALLTISANDAAVALTQATGSYAQGMAAINAEARHLRADDTVAVTPNGLDAPGQHTSAYDLALFGRQALTMPAFMKYDGVTSAQFKISKKKPVGLWNQNSLLATYPGALGGKIGWTSAAGATYVARPEPDGRRARPASRDQASGPGPSVLAAAGFSVMALVAAGLGFACSRRQRPARAQGSGGGTQRRP